MFSFERTYFSQFVNKTIEQMELNLHYFNSNGIAIIGTVYKINNIFKITI